MIHAAGRIGNRTRTAHLDDFQSVRIQPVNNRLLHRHAHIPVLDYVGIPVQGRLASDQQHAAFLVEIFGHEISGNIQGKNISEGNAGAFGDALHLFKQKRRFLLQEFRLLIYKVPVADHIKLGFRELFFDAGQVPGDAILQGFSGLDTLLIRRSLYFDGHIQR
ncbi:hypothetical protein D3C75_994260 [compost metagenome]